MMRGLTLILFLTLVAVAGIVFADDGMTACQAIHSFDVCHDALH